MTGFDVIALDGPGGVGKSTSGRGLAQRLGFAFLSSGRIYRALAWWALREGWQPPAPPDPKLVAGAMVEYTPDAREGSEPWRVNGEPVDADLGSDTISRAASVFSTHSEVRALADQAQRDTVKALESDGRYGGVILEGRDIGTVVFPDTRHKLFLTATAEERARRRHAELLRDDPSLKYESVLDALQERDARDEGRSIAPLKPAQDAKVIDTTSLTLDEVIEAMLKAVGRDS